MTRASHSEARSAKLGGAPAQERELRAQGRKTIGKLLDAALKAFGQRGYHATRVDDIVKLAKTSHGTFYLYYSNKEDLLRALVLQCAEEMKELADSLGDIGPDEAGFAELRGWLERYSDLYSSYGPVMRAWTEAAEMPASDFARLGRDVLTDFSKALAQRIKEADGDNVVDADIAAVAFVAMVDRYHSLALTRQVSFDREATLDTLARITHLGLFGGQRR
jgi:AcrR family transcriptional regulator